MEDAGLVWVVIVGRFEEELHHPLAWQGWQSGQEIALGQVQFLLNLVNGISRTEGQDYTISYLNTRKGTKFMMFILPLTLNLVLCAIVPLLSLDGFTSCRSFELHPVVIE